MRMYSTGSDAPAGSIARSKGWNTREKVRALGLPPAMPVGTRSNEAGTGGPIHYPAREGEA